MTIEQLQEMLSRALQAGFKPTDEVVVEVHDDRPQSIVSVDQHPETQRLIIVI